MFFRTGLFKSRERYSKTVLGSVGFPPVLSQGLLDDGPVFDDVCFLEHVGDVGTSHSHGLLAPVGI